MMHGQNHIKFGEALSAAWKETWMKNQIPCQEFSKLQQKLSLHPIA